MGLAFDYRQFAADQRRQAEQTALAMVRLMHLSAAEKWEILAAEIEQYEELPRKALSQDISY